jgi:hypothetical protein
MLGSPSGRMLGSPSGRMLGSRSWRRVPIGGEGFLSWSGLPLREPDLLASSSPRPPFGVAESLIQWH